jgi:outer membrane murein-binding lipoprotein Lpp
MNKLLLIAAILLLVSGCINRSPDQSAAKLTKQQQIEQAKRCAKLQQQVKDLKGKLIRQTTAREYYAQECL